MKIKLNSILLLVISLFVFESKAIAAEQYSCSYNVQYADKGFFDIKGVTDESGNFDVLYKSDSATWKSVSSYAPGASPVYYSANGTYKSEPQMMLDFRNLTVSTYKGLLQGTSLTTDCPVINVRFDGSTTYYFSFSNTSDGAYNYNIQGKLSGSKKSESGSNSGSSELKFTQECSSSLSTKNISGIGNFDVKTKFKMRSDGKKFICVSSSSSTLDSSCKEYDGGDFVNNVSNNGNVYNLTIPTSDLSGIFKQDSKQKSNNTFNCPSNLYLIFASATTDSLIITTDKKLADEYEGSVIGGATSSDNNNKKKDTESELYTGCPLGEDVTKDLYGALKIFKIAAPLLVIGFTIFEFVQALAKGDITAELKKLSQRLLKRCIFAVVLFFLPVLVNQVMQLANVWDENGTCDFSNSVEVKPDDPRTEDERRVTSCAGHSDLTSCNNDTTNKCKWSYSGNFCEAEVIKSDDENRITSCGGHSDLTSCNKDTTNNCKWNYTGNYCERVKCGDFGDNTTCTKNGCSWSYSGNFCEYKK